MNNRNPSGQPSGRAGNMSGLLIAGTVVDRMRRRVPANNPTTEIITYTIQDSENRKFFVDDYAPDSYYDLDKYVCLPVYIKPYLKKNGEPSFNFNVQKRQSGRGEHF